MVSNRCGVKGRLRDSALLRVLTSAPPCGPLTPMDRSFRHSDLGATLRPEWLDFFERTDANVEVESLQLRRIGIVGQPCIDSDRSGIPGRVPAEHAVGS